MISFNVSQVAFRQLNINYTTTLLTNKNNDLKTDTVLGFAVDKDGYFTDELNKAAGIPSDYKIHSDTIKSLVAVNTNSKNPFRYFNQIDIPKTIHNAYKILSQVAGDILNHKDSFSSDDIAKIPQAYKFNKKTLQVEKTYNNLHKYISDSYSFNPRRNDEKNKGLTTTFYNSSVLNYYTNGNTLKPSTDIFTNHNNGKESLKSGIYFNTTKDKYTNKDGTITKGGLLVGILNQNSHTHEGKATYMGILSGLDKNVDSQSYQSQISLWSLNHDPHTISESEYNALSEPMKAYVDFTRSIGKRIANGVFSDTTGDEKTANQKNPIELLLEQMNEQFKKQLKRLALKAKEARIAQQEAKRHNATELNKNLKKALDEMLKFIADTSKTHKIEIDTNEIKRNFLEVFKKQQHNKYNIDIRA